MKLWKKIALAVPLLLILVIGVAVAGGWWFSIPTNQETAARLAQSPHFKQGAFANIEPQAPTEFSVKMLREGLADHPRTNPTGAIPVVPISKEALAQPPAPGLRAAWIGHASVLFEIDGVRILTDPVFSERASPLGFAGPKRFHPTPIPLEDLQNIDAVIITHNHYDHLDKAVVIHLAQQGTKFFVPLGNKPLLLGWDIPDNQISEMEWWQGEYVKTVRIVATPSRHYSNRGIFDFKKSLWASWSLIGLENRVFVSGDSGYTKSFKSIGERLGPFDLTAIKVGAYGPGKSWLDVHMTPENSIRTHQDVRGKTLLPVHWGTFDLAYHPWDEPIIRAIKAAEAENVTVITPRVGEMVDINKPHTNEAWWESVD